MTNEMSIHDLLYMARLHVMYLDELECSARSTSLTLLQSSRLDRGYNAGVPAIR